MISYRILGITFIFLSAAMAIIILTTFAIAMVAKGVLFCHSYFDANTKVSSREYKNIEISSFNYETEKDLYNSNEEEDIFRDEIEFEEYKREKMALNFIPLPRGSTIHIINRKRNFSDAAQYCSKLKTNARLLTMDNEIEENYVMEYLKQNKSAFEVCDQYFIGYRNVMDKLFLSPDGILFYPSNEISSQVSDFYLYHNKQCGKLSLISSSKIESISCETESICFICDVFEENCGGKLLCQKFVNVLWPPMTFSAANKYCKEKFPNSEGLAMFHGSQIPMVFRNLIWRMSSDQLAANYECLLLRANLSNAYETSDEVPMTYQSHRINVDNYKDHCLVISKNRNFKWISESCSRLNCFVCRIDEV